MAVKTMAKNTGTGQYNAGWHELTISKATDGTWNDKRTIDLNFKDYPENIRHRVFETHNKTSGDEFAISNLFRYACAGIISVLNDPTGKNPVIQYDDEAENLVGTRINVFFYKKKADDGNEYSRPFDTVAPVEQETKYVSWTADDVARLKASAEKNFVRVKGDKVDHTNHHTTAKTTTTSDAELPF